MGKTLFAFLICSLTGCAAIITPQASGGSRADGIVEFTYSHGVLIRPQINWQTTADQAIQRCASWGYATAEAFPGTVSQCISYSTSGCAAYQYTVSYQCGGPSAAR